MIQTLLIIKFIYPFILLTVFFALYRKQYRCMQAFYWRMTMQYSARRFYTLVLLILLIFLNWCSYETDHNLAVGLSAAMSASLMFSDVAERIMLSLHKYKRLWLTTLILAMVCYCIPYMNSMFIVLFTVSVASQFYPSERVLFLRSHPQYFTNRMSLLMMIRTYYY